jgi:hypothetical protein
MVSQNWKLFVARLSGFWLRKMLLGHLEQKLFPTMTKKMEGTNGLDPLLSHPCLLCLLPLPWVRMVVYGLCPYPGQSMFPYIVIHHIHKYG